MTLIVRWILQMGYSTEPKYRKNIEEYWFLSFARKFGYKYGQKSLDAATKIGINTAKTASKRGLFKKQSRQRKI